ncbi:extensin-like [Macadamia integrifolia]|uniref:extensin-like n=1 Tax=Macadamia integrifolia TaxID=60698 RepID=UPI001C4EA172|nr:extensin-like [Macadamia integrifolia]
MNVYANICVLLAVILLIPTLTRCRELAEMPRTEEKGSAIDLSVDDYPHCHCGDYYYCDRRRCRPPTPARTPPTPPPPPAPVLSPPPPAQPIKPPCHITPPAPVLSPPPHFRPIHPCHMYGTEFRCSPPHGWHPLQHRHEPRLDEP